MNGATFPGYRFDGRTAAATAVLVRIEQGELIVSACDGSELERQPVEPGTISEPFAHAPRMIALRGGATLEVPDADRRFLHALEASGVRFSQSVRLQAWWPAALVALAAVCALSGLIYFKWLPAAVRWIAFALPHQLETRMGDELLRVLDEHYLEPSRLQADEHMRILDRFTRAAALVAPNIRYRLEFRDGGDDEINAMALPGGTIVLLDGLVVFADNDERVLAVLAHELGHVVHKHSARQVLQSIGIGALASLLWGDFSGIAASVPLVIGLLRYSRDFERDADDFAVTLLRTQELSPRPLYEFFESLREREDETGISDIPDFLSTHPSTAERIERLKGMAEAE